MIKDIVYFAKTNPNAKIPSKRESDGGYDIYACFDENEMIIQPLSNVLVPTGIASAFSEDYVFVLEERGSSAVKNMKKSAGIIDSSYRGEWFVCLYNGNTKPILLTKETNEIMLGVLKDDYIIYPYEKAVCQALLMTVPKVTIHEIDYSDLKQIASDRGEGALGSSGK